MHGSQNYSSAKVAFFLSGQETGRRESGERGNDKKKLCQAGNTIKGVGREGGAGGSDCQNIGRGGGGLQ